MKYTAEQLDNVDLDRISAEVCMGWQFQTVQGLTSGFYLMKDSCRFPSTIWQPTKETERGKAQCFDLLKLLILKGHTLEMIRINNVETFYIDDLFDNLATKDTELQKAIVKAAILAAQEKRVE